MSKIPPKGSDEALEGLSQKDFAEPLELALDRRWEEAAGKLAGTLAGVWGGPLAGATAEHLASAAVARFRGSPATLRFLEEGAKWDDEQAKEAARLEAEARFLRAIQQAICDDAETGASERGRAVVSALERWATRLEHLLEQVTNKLDGLRAGQRQLLEGQSRTVATLDRMNAESALQARRALERYREWLLDRCDAMPGLFKEALHVSKLSTVFVEPELYRDEQRRSRGTGGPSKGSDAAFADRRGAFRGRDEAWAERDGAFEGTLRTAGGISLRELVERSSKDRAARWVVLGEPGSGKSTLARHLALELASESMAVAARSKGLPDEVPGLWPEWEPASGTAALSTEQGVARGSGTVLCPSIWSFPPSRRARSTAPAFIPSRLPRRSWRPRVGAPRRARASTGHSGTGVSGPAVSGFCWTVSTNSRTGSGAG